MNENKQQKPGFWKRIRTRYKLSFFKENTLEEVWTIHLSLLGVVLSALLLTVIIGVGVTSFIVATPIRNLLPGYLKSETRDKLVDNALRIDSLMYQMQIRDRYIANIADILNDNITIDSNGVMQSIDSTRSWSPEILTYASTESNEFAKKYEEEEKFMLNMLPPPTEGLLFYPPVKGSVVKPFNPQDGLYGILIQAPRRSAVSSILDGTIASVSYTVEHEYVVTVQHNNNYLSIYRNNSECLRRTGEKVAAGEKIAIVGNNDRESRTSSIVEFELWHSGKALNPEEYITF